MSVFTDKTYSMVNNVKEVIEERLKDETGEDVQIIIVMRHNEGGESEIGVCTSVSNKDMGLCFTDLLINMDKQGILPDIDIKVEEHLKQ